VIAGCEGGRQVLLTEAPGRILVQVHDRDDGSPQGDVKLVLMDLAANRPVHGPVTTGATGTVLFPDLPRGRYAVLAFPGGGRGVYHLPGSVRVPRLIESPPIGAKLPPGVTAPWAPPPAGSEPVLVPILTYRSHEFADDLPRIRGQIVDAQTGQPLPVAFVSTPSHIVAYSGSYTVRDDVTGADGRFHVADIPFAEDPFSGNLIQIVPLTVNREGFLGVNWFYDPPHGDNNLDITGVVIALQPAVASSGVLTGRVTFLDEPVADLLVGLAHAGEPTPPPGKAAGGGQPDQASWPPGAGAQGGVGIPGLTARTDSLGGYRFTGLPENWYIVHPGFPADDAYWLIGQPADRPRQVIDGQTTVAEDLAILKAIFPVTPAAGAILALPPAVLRWTAVAEADSYAVSLNRTILGVVAGTEIEVPVETVIEPGSNAWGVTAILQDGVPVGGMERSARFLMEGDGVP